ncbi:TnsA-like heteromeric transposase endonuclease subunit [Streptomyces sp. NPDC000851]
MLASSAPLRSFHLVSAERGWLVEAEGFWLEYSDARGEVHGGPVEVMWPTRFEAAGQVRAFPSYRGQRNFSGWYWAATCSELVGYESWVELGHLMRLDAEPDVVAVASQPFRLSWRYGGRGRRIKHTPDYFVRGARRGLIISGERTTGKTTALRQLGRLHELRIRQRYGDSRRIPVVYVTAPPKGSARKPALEFARFLKLPTISPRHNTADITSSVCQVLTEARTDLVLVLQP